MKGRLTGSVAGAVLAAGAMAAAQAEDVGVLMETSQGAIELELYPDKAPRTVDNFLTYVDEGFYDGTIFHRVIDGFMIQGGGYDTDYERKPTREPVPNEADNGLKNEKGTIAMARTSDPHSATAQFFINDADNPNLDHRARTARGWGYAVFGRVTDGMDVVERISTQPTRVRSAGLRNVPETPVVIERVTRIQAEEQGE
ncbi:MAG: peptidylprolyl isomerase [Chromatiales bacterium]|jgi:cyclophilin family peptidyl-prolyl cis-trans isomerase